MFRSTALAKESIDIDQAFHSITYGTVSFTEMCDLVAKFMEEQPDNPYVISAGTDSQNHYATRFIVVVAVHRVGRGGIFFYYRIEAPKIVAVRQKLLYETSLSLNIADRLMEYLDILEYNVTFAIHVDAGQNGKTASVIPEIAGWVRAQGFVCLVKPDSYAASTIADKYSK
jgi:predicted RNase H-related nuclease YkuK (DUF458 family)